MASGGKKVYCGALAPEGLVGVGDFLGVAIEGDFAVFDEDGAVAVFDDVAHVVSDQDDGLFALDGVEIVGAFLLEGGVADGEDFV